MALSVPVTLVELRARVLNITSLTATFSRDEVRDAINYGYRKLLRAIRSVQPQPSMAFKDNFAFTAGESEYDISDIEPSIHRITKLIVPGIPANQGSSGQVVNFQYRDLRSGDFQGAEACGANAGSGVFYDILTGRLPQRNVADPTAEGNAQITTIVSSNTIKVTAPVSGGVAIGQLIQIPFWGESHRIDGSGDDEGSFYVPTDYWGTVVAVSTVGDLTTIQLSPDISFLPSVAGRIHLYRTQVLMIAPAFASGLTGRLYYTYQPVRLVKDTERITPAASEHSDTIVAYAASWLLRGTDDSQAERWYLEGQEMRSEALQDLDPVADQGTQSFDTGLPGSDW